ncbi:MAG: hypothetical protein K2I56_04330 [Muribaculaceae bacterium]|nr:hypothetical protein [Muribaculaceae bacterium]
MKMFKYLSFALLAVAAVGCSEDTPDPNAVDPGSFFPSYADKAYQKCAPNPDEGVYDNTFEVQICRTSNTVGEAVRLEYSVKVYDAVTDSYVEGSKDLFTVPEKYVYETNMPMGFIPVVAHNELMEIHETVLLTITILDDTTFGANTIEVEYQRVYPEESWTQLSTCTVVDGWIFSIFGIDPFDYSFECSYEINDADHHLFRLVNPYQSNSYFEGIRAMNIAPANERYYVVIDLNNFKAPAVMPSVSGYEFGPDVMTIGMVTIMNEEGALMADGYTADEIAAPGALEEESRSTFADNVFNINTCLFKGGQGQGPYNNGGKGQVVFPPHIPIVEDVTPAAAAKITPDSRSSVMRKLSEQYMQLKLDRKI